MPPARLPEGSVLLHIGPYKTGSTAVQTALFARREELAAHGVAYPGPRSRAGRQGWSVLGWSPAGQELPPPALWERYAAKVRSLAPLRVCVSTEDFGSIQDPALAARIVDSLGGENVHVVTVCRALHKVLPSHWQERVKSAMDTRTYEEYLRSALVPEEQDEAGAAFWRSHALDRTAALWLETVGPERFTLVTADGSESRLLPAVFETMLGLPAHFLDSRSEGANASLSLNAVELLRRLNVEARARSWPAPRYVDLIRAGGLHALLGTPPGEGDQRIPALPAWAVEPVAAVGRERLATIERLGLRPVGDVSSLLLPDDYVPGAADLTPATISMDGAVAVAGGVIERDTRRREHDEVRRARAAEKAAAPSGALGQASARSLAGELALRARRRVRRALPGRRS